MQQPGRFLATILEPLLRSELILIKNVIKAIDKNLFIPLGLTAGAAASATDVAIYKKCLE